MKILDRGRHLRQHGQLDEAIDRRRGVATGGPDTLEEDRLARAPAPRIGPPRETPRQRSVNLVRADGRCRIGACGRPACRWRRRVLAPRMSCIVRPIANRSAIPPVPKPAPCRRPKVDVNAAYPRLSRLPPPGRRRACGVPRRDGIAVHVVPSRRPCALAARPAAPNRCAPAPLRGEARPETYQ